MTTGTRSSRPRGRPPAFERAEVLDRVMELFWAQGFEATAMADVVNVTGLNKSSLYNAFGSKDELFALALDRYLELRLGMLGGLLTDGSAGLDDIETFLDFVETEAAGDRGRLGCLAVNTSTELAPTDAALARTAQRFRDEMRTAIGAALRRAEAAGEIEPGTVERDTAILLAFMLSLSVIARAGADTAELGTQFSAIRSQLAEWRLDR